MATPPTPHTRAHAHTSAAAQCATPIEQHRETILILITNARNSRFHVEPGWLADSQSQCWVFCHGHNHRCASLVIPPAEAVQAILALIALPLADPG